MKKIVLIAVPALFALTACGGGSDGKDADEFGARNVPLPDGRTVICVAWRQGYAGGLDCDYENAK